MSNRSYRRTKVPIHSNRVLIPANQLQVRPFVVQTKALSTKDSKQTSRLDTGLIQNLSLQPKLTTLASGNKDKQKTDFHPATSSELIQRFDLFDTISEGIDTISSHVGKAANWALDSIVSLIKPKYAYVKSKDCTLRSPPPDLKSYGISIPRNTQLKILKTATVKSGKKEKEYAYVEEILPDDFVGPRQYQGWTLLSNLTQLDKPTTFKLQSSYQKFANKVLVKAKVDPKTWFSNFRHTTFLGRHTATPIHKELADQLKRAEKTLVASHSNGTGSPEIAGDNLGLSPKLEPIKGARKHATSASRSMHFFGLAIDLDYTANPFINESENDRDAINAVFPRASLLVHGKAMKYQKTKSEDTEEQKAEKLNNIFKLDKTLETYFSYIDNDKQLNARLAAASTAGTKFWKDQDFSKARKRIKEDLKWVVGVWRAKRNKKSYTALVKQGGFTNFERALVDGIGLHWGGTYGDMMHFDMRNTGTGAIIAEKRHKVTAPE
ncbi:hypothetical protein [Leptothoe spongobia]|uniref:Uncharacterized protein n=1 Tax=Leptothoe spongobia TAU-MAC 1115 TaxID=1967444 RepID=A0A947DGX4_9CYAN|nr:hypothetical protein [Leptothoe spongobia]MBT9316651.1 hypothetical protein [Leptothoe spongobia TAU-MAC 1115]